jgi:acylphosphatase
MQKLKLKITGSRVHDVGYRVFLVNKALTLGINNFNTFNTHLNGTQAVIAIIEADDEAIEEFKNFVTSFTPKEAVVENVYFEEYGNLVPPIERVMQAFQMEQWGKGIPILLQMLERQDKTLEKQDKTLEKQDKMLEKEDTTVQILERIRGDMSDTKSTLSRIEIDLKDTKFSLSSFIEEKYRKMEGEIAEIKATLARMQARI